MIQMPRIMAIKPQVDKSGAEVTPSLSLCSDGAVAPESGVAIGEGAGAGAGGRRRGRSERASY